MGRHDHLRGARLVHAPQHLQQFDLARRRKRALGLVENIDALPAAALLEEVDKAFAMRPGQKVGRYSAGFPGRLVEVTGNGIEGFGAEEPTGSNLRQPVATKRIS